MIDGALVPPAWQIVPIRRVLRQLQRTPGPDAGVITAYRDGEVTLRSTRRQEGYTLSDAETGYQGVESGDLVFHALDGFAGAVGVSSARGKCSPVYHVCSAPLGDDPGFVAYSLRAMGSCGFLALQAGNVRQRSVDFRAWDTFGRIPLIRPPVPLQASIADRLDAETARIDSVIRKNKQLVNSLLARRYATVARHVLAKADENWIPTRLKYVAKINAQSLPETHNPAFAFWYADIGSVGRGRLARDLEKLRFSEAPSRARRVVRRGDTLVSTVRTYLRCVWSLRDELDLPTIASTGFAVLTPGAEVDARFLGWWAESDACIDNVVADSVGISYPAISAEALGDLPILLPPLDEQRHIADALDNDVDLIEQAIRAIAKQTSVLRERRDAVIAAAVTGQLDFAQVAA